jgi:hypothetical protein
MNDELKLELVDLGDATVETREVGPGAYEDALVGIGRKQQA